MKVEWDPGKNEINQFKHGVDFETAQLVFDDPNCITFVERITNGEERWHAIGSVEDVIILVVVHTYRAECPDEIIRIISARPATRRERRLYCASYRLKNESSFKDSLQNPIETLI